MFHFCVEKEKEKMLMVHLNNSMSVGAQEGEKITLHFDSALEIMDAIRKVYDATKCQVTSFSFSLLE